MIHDINEIEESTGKTFRLIVGHRGGPRDEQGVEPLGDPIGFELLGPGSDAYAAADREIQLLNVKEAAARKSVVKLDSDDGAAIVVDGGEKRRQIAIDHCVVGWFGFTVGAELAPFTRENLAKVLKARPLWVRRIVAAIEDEANFGGG